MIQFGEMINDIISRCNRLISAALNSKDEGLNSKDDACNRLKLVLMHDRSKLPPATLEKMRDELVQVISKYVEIVRETLDLNLASEGNSIALVASIPVLRHKKQEEIDALEENEAKTETTVAENTETEENQTEDAGDVSNTENCKTVEPQAVVTVESDEQVAEATILENCEVLNAENALQDSVIEIEAEKNETD